MERRFVYNLYMKQRVKLRLNQCETGYVKIGCMSPILFNPYGEHLMKEALTGVENFKIRGKNINKLRFCGWYGYYSKNEKELQDMVNRLVVTRRK